MAPVCALKVPGAQEKGHWLYTSVDAFENRPTGQGSHFPVLATMYKPAPHVERVHFEDLGKLIYPTPQLRHTEAPAPEE